MPAATVADRVGPVDATCDSRRVSPAAGLDAGRPAVAEFRPMLNQDFDGPTGRTYDEAGGEASVDGSTEVAHTIARE